MAFKESVKVSVTPVVAVGNATKPVEVAHGLVAAPVTGRAPVLKFAVKVAAGGNRPAICTVPLADTKPEEVGFL